MAKEIKFKIKLTVDGKEQLQTVTTDAGELQKAMDKAKTSAQRFTDAFVNFNQGIEYVRNLTDAFSFLDDKLSRNRDISVLTGLQGGDMKKLRNGVEAVAEYFGKDFNEVLRSVNSLSKGFGISMYEALRLVRDGMVSGADAGGDFLDTVREYPRYFKEAGLSAEDFVAITANAARQGVFSDKGVDTIKEANIRLREMTTATAAALEGIGMSADLVQQQLQDGSVTTFEVMRQVAAKLSELPPSASEVGTAIADIFGGPGEDAGLEYIKTLAGVKLSMDEVKAATNGVAEQQEQQIARQEELKNGLLGLIDLSGVYAKMKPYVDTAAQIGFAVSGVASLANTLKIANVQAALARARTAALNAAALATGAGLGRTAAMARVFSAALRGTAYSATALKLALRALVSATVVGAAIAALTWAVEQLTGAMRDGGDAADAAADGMAGLGQAHDTFASEAARVQVELDGEREKLGRLIKSGADTAAMVAHLNDAYGSAFGYYRTAAEWYDTLTSKSKAYAMQLGYEAEARELGQRTAKAQLDVDELNSRISAAYKDGRAYERKVVAAPGGTGYSVLRGGKTEELLGLEAARDKALAEGRAAARMMRDAQKRAEAEARKLAGTGAAGAVGARSAGTVGARSAGAGLARAAYDRPAETGSMDWYEKRLADIRKEIQATGDAERAKTLQAEYESVEEEFKDFRISIGLDEPEEKEAKTYVGKLQEQLSDAQRDFDNAATVEARVEAQARIDDIQAEIDEAVRGRLTIEADVEPQYITQGSAEDKRQSYGNARQRADRIQQDYEIGLIGKDEALAGLAELNAQVEALGLKPVHIEVETEDLDRAREKTRQTQDALRDGWGGIKGIGDGIRGITDALEGNAGAWQKITSVVDGTIQMFQSIMAVVGLIRLLTGATDTQTMAEGAKAGATAASATAMTAAAAGQAAQAAASVPVIAANKALTASYMELASAMFFAAHASIPFAGFGIASGFASAAKAFVAAMGATPFARGGVVSGPTLALVGEYAGAANNPEVIAPLDKLRSMLQPQGAAQGGSVRFEIDGRKLVGVLANETRVSGKSGRRTGIRI